MPARAAQSRTPRQGSSTGRAVRAYLVLLGFVMASEESKVPSQDPRRRWDGLLSSTEIEGIYRAWPGVTHWFSPELTARLLHVVNSVMIFRPREQIASHGQHVTRPRESEHHGALAGMAAVGGCPTTMHDGPAARRVRAVGHNSFIRPMRLRPVTGPGGQTTDRAAPRRSRQTASVPSPRRLSAEAECRRRRTHMVAPFLGGH